MGAQIRKIQRAAVRDVEALERILVSKQELNTTGERVRTALRGNTQSGMRRRAKKAIAMAEAGYKSVDTVKVIRHAVGLRPADAFAEDGEPHAEVVYREQTIKFASKFQRVPVASVAMEFAKAEGAARTPNT